MWLKLHDGDREADCLGQNGSGGVTETWHYWDTKGQGEQGSLQQTLRLWVLCRDPQCLGYVHPGHTPAQSSYPSPSRWDCCFLPGLPQV